MNFLKLLAPFLSILVLPALAIPTRAAMIPEGTQECQKLATFTFPVTGTPPAGTTYSNVHDGLATVSNRYNTGASCGYLHRGPLRLWFQIAPAVVRPESAPWLFFINGGPGIADGFRAAQFLKLRDRYNLAWFHQRGTGLSPLTLSQSSDCTVASLAQNVQDLRALQNILSPNRPVVLLAHSWGGLIAQSFAAHFPAAVLGIVTSGTGVGFEFARHAFVNGNQSLFPYHDFLITLLRQATPETIARYNAAELAIAAKLKNGLLVTLQPDNRADRMFAPQFIVALKNYLGRTGFDAALALKLVEGIANGQVNPSGLAELGIETSSMNHIVNNTILCGDALPGMLAALPKELGESMTRGCREIAPGCHNPVIDFESLPGGIHAPALILAGTNDQVSPVEDQRRLAQMIDRARFVELPNAAHGDFLELNFNAFPAMLSFLGVAANWTPATWQDQLR